LSATETQSDGAPPPPAKVGWTHSNIEHSKTKKNMLGTILLVLLVLVLLGALPTWPHSRSWGYYPSGGLGLVLIIVVILILTGKI
jgi:hypothetical protein